MRGNRIFTTKHKIGNMVSGLADIVDGLILFFTLGNYTPDFSLEWAIYRRTTGVLCDNGKDDV